MEVSRCIEVPIRRTILSTVALGMVAIGFASCSGSNRPPERVDTDFGQAWPKAERPWGETVYGRLVVTLPEIPDAEKVDDDELCENCHETYVKTFSGNVHSAESCESCHGPASRHMETRGKEPGLIRSFSTMNSCEKSEVCLQCHEENQCSPGCRWRTSVHAHKGVACTDCHRGHHNVPVGTPSTTESGGSATQRPAPLPDVATVYQQASSEGYLVRGQDPAYDASLSTASPELDTLAPGICYKCHCDKQVYQEIAGPHQICGPNGFNCTTCHDPHGRIKERTRKELCLECHGQGSPTMAWHSSTHDLQGVACVDCHNPHPCTEVPRIVAISHTSIQRPKRLSMSVDDPVTCYKCHPKIFGLNALPAHHPIKEGKMTCSDCHDSHGQLEGNLRAETLNLLCWKCHAEKQGPFVYEHPPVTENCAYCHDPHGTVANNLLRQPTTFLCLRCHSGHRRRHGFADIDMNVDMQQAFYTDCTLCHTQIHGSDQPGSVRKQSLRR